MSLLDDIIEANKNQDTFRHLARSRDLLALDKRVVTNEGAIAAAQAAITNLEAPRRLTGVVEVTGAAALVIAGTGFTVTRLGTGDIRINFNVPFAVPPVVIATPMKTIAVAGDARQTQLEDSVTINNATIYILDNAGNFQAGRLHFAAFSV